MEDSELGRTRDTGIKIIPIRIEFFDQTNFPRSIPLFQSLLALDRILDIAELFEIDQFVDFVFLRETLGQFQAMLADPSNDVIGYTDVQRAADAAGEDVDSSCVLPLGVSGILGRPVKPGDDSLVCGGGQTQTRSTSYSPAWSLRGSGNNSGADGFTAHGASAGASGLLKSSSSIRPARFSILSAEIRI
jgi:hypothetical protein